MASNQGNGQSSVPGLHMFDGLVQAYTNAWRKYADTLNDVWSDVTSSDADSSDWGAALSKLMQAASDNVRDLTTAYSGMYTNGGKDHTPVLVFVIDQVANASARSQSVPIREGIDPTKITFTELKSVGDGELLPGKLKLTMNAGTRCLDVSIKDLEADDPKKAGHYVSVIYENVTPAPRCALAVVVLTFPESGFTAP